MNKRLLLMTTFILTIFCFNIKEVDAYSANNYSNRNLCAAYELAGFHSDGVIAQVGCYASYDEAKKVMKENGADDFLSEPVNIDECFNPASSDSLSLQTPSTPTCPYWPNLNNDIYFSHPVALTETPPYSASITGNGALIALHSALIFKNPLPQRQPRRG